MAKPLAQTAEFLRLNAAEERVLDWKNWGPYVAERAWGTVREDYGDGNHVWEYFPHDQARSRAYRWNEDGLGGLCNRFQNLCFAVALWNGRDPILKERLFGLTGDEGNHGEDVKEYYFYLDATPTHSYLKMLYKYPQAPYPYEQLLRENQARTRHDPEYELIDALGDAFAGQRYFDVQIEYAKASPDDILCRITATNRGPQPAPLHVLPHVWYRNTWSWGYDPTRPELAAIDDRTVRIVERHLGERFWYVSAQAGTPANQAGTPANQAGTPANLHLLFTENDTDSERLFRSPDETRYVKDAFHDRVIQGREDRVNPARRGTKAAAWHQTTLGPGESAIFCTRFCPQANPAPFADFNPIFKQRIAEADEFYGAIQQREMHADARRVQRQAFAGLMWSKQFYHYSVELWLAGDPGQPPPPAERKQGRNADWGHVYTLDVLSMPDKWEYPWFAAWDLAFHTLPLAMIDPQWAKRQLILLLREWYMHPNGQIPAYEWNFSDVNPPVHAWAAWQVYKINRHATGVGDTEFLEEVFHKLLLNFTWWVNRKDAAGLNIFQGGFLGMDNIGVFDRSSPLPAGGSLEQADGTAWMGMYCLNMLAIALELARTRPAYEAIATKFFEHFIYIAAAINGEECGLWDAADGFYYDTIRSPDGGKQRLKIRSLVGMVPLLAVETLEPDLLDKLPHFRRRMEWFIKYRPNLLQHVASLTEPGKNGRRLLTIVDRQKLERIVPRMLDPEQFLSEFGLRSLSRALGNEPYTFACAGDVHTVDYEPAESTTGLFGGNSNWRGPIWFPLNYLMIEALQKYHHYYGDDVLVDLPRGSGKKFNLDQVGAELSRRLTHIFLRDEQRDGRRAVFGDRPLFQNDPHWRDHIPFYEYFHGETGAGLGASHQTGWTALVAKLLQQG